ncbi:MAG: hypothetical protein LW892_01250, partial [Betaproteobacteria bacterium]|nr:hypothetical protein [Betaproteobacteria bacterium]
APQQNEISSNKTDSYEDKVGASPAQQPPLTEPTAAPVVAAAPAPTKTPDPAPKATGKLLRERLAATEQWLAQSTPQTYTVQLLGADNEIQLNQHLRFIANIIEINNVFVYRTLAKGEPALTLTWGSFDNPRAAREAMAKLPPALKQYRPLLRTVQGIRTEIASNNPS